MTSPCSAAKARAAAGVVVISVLGDSEPGDQRLGGLERFGSVTAHRCRAVQHRGRADFAERPQGVDDGGALTGRGGSRWAQIDAVHGGEVNRCSADGQAAADLRIKPSGPPPSVMGLRRWRPKD